MNKLYDMQTGVPGVRVAVPADEEQLYELLCKLHSENGMFSLNPAKVVAGIRWATERKGGIIFVIEEDDRIVASLGMLIARDWYSDDEYLMERWNYVHPDYRRSNHARKLIEQAKWLSDWFTNEARKNGRPPVPFQCGINSLDRTEGKVRLYARHMVCIGAFFLYGHVPLRDSKMQAEVRRIEEMNTKAHRERSKEVVTVVETILRVGQRGADHVH